MTHISRKQAKKSGRGVGIACLILAIIVVAILVLTALSSSGTFLRATDAIYTKNFTVNKAMMSFFFNESIMKWYSNYSMYVQYGIYSVNLSTDLKSQLLKESEVTTFGMEKGATWYDYFLKSSVDELTRYLAYAEGALAMGLELDDEDREGIEATIDSINESLESNYSTYSSWYGSGVKEKDVRDCYEIIYLASKFYEKKVELIEKDVLDNDPDAMGKFANENKEDFYTAEVLKFSVSEKSNNYENDEAYEKAKKEAMAELEKFKEAKTPDAFLECIKNYNEKKAAEEAEDKEEEETSSTTAATTTAEELEVEDFKSEIEYSTVTGGVEEWLFGEETEAQSGDVNIFEEEETATETVTNDSGKAETDTSGKNVTEKVKKYTASVYFVMTPSSLDKDITREVGYVISSDKNIADAVFAEFKKNTMTAEKLNELGEAQNEKLAEDSKTVIYHNSEERVKPGYFDEYKFPDIEDWLENEKTLPGTCSGVMKVTTTTTAGSETVKDTYYAVCYYEKDDEEVWFVDALNGVVEEKFEVWYKGEDGKGGQLKTTPVTVNTAKLKDLESIRLSSSSAS